MICYIKLLRY